MRLRYVNKKRKEKCRGMAEIGTDRPTAVNVKGIGAACC